MTLTAYRQVLAVPGVARVLLVATVARIPSTAVGLVLTLHVVGPLGRGYGAAGLMTAAYTVGMAIGAPWRGVAVDRYGVRAALWPSIAVELAFWSAAPWMSFEVLLPGAVLLGVFCLPVYSLTRQMIGVVVPEPLRRTGFALDSITVELSYMVGPMLGVLLVTQASPAVAMPALGAAQVLAGLALILLNPPVRSAAPAAGVRDGRREWFTPQFVSVLLLMASALLVLAGTDVATVAVLRASEHTDVIGLVFGTWCVGSILGGVVYGGISRAVSSATVVVGLALVTIPVGLVESWQVLALVLVPVGALCAPSLSATVADVSRLVPESRRGEAMGWHATAGTLGLAVGAPLTGVAIDHLGPGWGFAAAGTAGLALALVALLVGRAGRDRVRVEEVGARDAGVAA